MSSFNNTRIIKIKVTSNGLHLTYRSLNNWDCIIEEVIEKRDDFELEFTKDVLHRMIDILELDYSVKTDDQDIEKKIEINIVEN